MARGRRYEDLLQVREEMRLVAALLFVHVDRGTDLGITGVLHEGRHPDRVCTQQQTCHAIVHGSFTHSTVVHGLELECLHGTQTGPPAFEQRGALANDEVQSLGAQREGTSEVA